jgi:hypothetical protein
VGLRNLSESELESQIASVFKPTRRRLTKHIKSTAWQKVLRSSPSAMSAVLFETSQIPKGSVRSTRRRVFLSCRLNTSKACKTLRVLAFVRTLVFDRVDGFDSLASPPHRYPPHGVFATRSPRGATHWVDGGQSSCVETASEVAVSQVSTCSMERHPRHQTVPLGRPD